jgi:uncharacterized protein YjbI with pentapeptide repeats/protein-tyrosine phosphatase
MADITREKVIALIESGEEINLDGYDLSELDLSKLNLSNAQLNGTNLIKTNLAGSNLTNAWFVEATLDSIIIDNANFTGALFESTVLRNFDFRKGNFHNVILSWLRLEEGINLSGADLTGVEWSRGAISQIDLSGTIMRGGSFREVTFREVNLVGTDFNNSQLYEVWFFGVLIGNANFENANFGNSIFSGVNFSAANLNGVTMKYTRYDDRTIFPADFDPSKKGAIPKVYTVHTYKKPGYLYDPEQVNLCILSRPRGGDWLEDEIKRLRYNRIEVLVSLLTPEENRELDLHREAELAANYDITFLAFPITDRQVPQSMSAALEFFRKLARYIEVEKKNVAVHCRMGIGRSALVAAAVMVLLGYQPDEAFDLITHHRAAIVPDTDEQREWVNSFAEYARQNG